MTNQFTQKFICLLFVVVILIHSCQLSPLSPGLGLNPTISYPGVSHERPKSFGFINKTLLCRMCNQVLHKILVRIVIPVNLTRPHSAFVCHCLRSGFTALNLLLRTFYDHSIGDAVQSLKQLPHVSHSLEYLLIVWVQFVIVTKTNCYLLLQHNIYLHYIFAYITCMRRIHALFTCTISGLIFTISLLKRLERYYVHAPVLNIAEAILHGTNIKLQ